MAHARQTEALLDDLELIDMEKTRGMPGSTAALFTFFARVMDRYLEVQRHGHGWVFAVAEELASLGYVVYRADEGGTG